MIFGNPYAGVAGHPLRNVDPAVLDAARGVLRDAATTRDVEPELSDAIADAVVAALMRKGVSKYQSDGFHTFTELYGHRRALVLMLMRSHPAISWITSRHHPEDGPMYDDSFMIGIDSPAGPIRYHVGVEHRALFAGIREIEHAPRWDGAGPDATVERLHAWSGLMAEIYAGTLDDPR